MYNEIKIKIEKMKTKLKKKGIKKRNCNKYKEILNRGLSKNCFHHAGSIFVAKILTHSPSSS